MNVWPNYCLEATLGQADTPEQIVQLAETEVLQLPEQIRFTIL